MRKSVIDLTAKELEKLAGEAWSTAAQDALAKGLPVTGSRNGRRFRQYADGRVEDLGPVASFSDDDSAASKAKTKKYHSSAA